VYSGKGPAAINIMSILQGGEIDLFPAYVLIFNIAQYQANKGEK
jgi:hypothetical protein